MKDMAAEEELRGFANHLLQGFFDKEITRLKECVSGTVMYKQNFHKKYEEIAELSKKFNRNPERIHKAILQTKRAIENMDFVADQELCEIRAAMAGLVEKKEEQIDTTNNEDENVSESRES